MSMASTKPGSTRWSIASRVVAGTLGAYALASVITVALSLLLVRLGVNAVEAATGSTIASFAFFAVAAICVFHARSARRAWGWLLLVGMPCGIAAAVMTGIKP